MERLIQTIKAAGLLCILLLQGCNTLPASERLTTNTATASPTQTPIEMAVAQYNLFLQSGSLLNLKNAREYAAQAFQQQSDNVSIQEIHYTVEYMSAAIHKQQDLSELTRLYQQLNPLLRANMAPPKNLPYLYARKAKAPIKDLIQLLLQALQEQPLNANLWLELSTQYEDDDNVWMAIYAAQRAAALEPEDASIQFQLGESLHAVAMNSGCAYEEKPYLKAALPYFLKAIALKPQQLYLDNAALIYLRLGLPPLAYDQAKKAWQLQKNKWTGTHYAQAALQLGKIDEARTVAKETIQQFDEIELYTLLIAIDLRQGQWQSAAKTSDIFLTELRKRYPGSNSANFFTPLSSQWFNAIANQHSQPLELQSLSANSEWGNTLLQAIHNRSQNATSPPLIQFAQTACQKTEALFYEALLSWMQGDVNQAKILLQQIKPLGITLYQESIYADALLASPLLP